MALKAFAVLSLSLLSQCNAHVIHARKQDPSIPTRNSPDAPVDVIPSEFSVEFSSDIPQKGGWDTKRYFTNSIEWTLELGKGGSAGDIGTVQLWQEGATFNLKAHPQSNSTFPRRYLLWGLYKGLEYRLQNADWRPGKFDLNFNGETQGVLEFIDNPEAADNGDGNANGNGTSSKTLKDENRFILNTKWLDKTIINDNDLLLPVARMALSVATFGIDNVVPSPLGWQHVLDIPNNKTSGVNDRIQINVSEPAHPGGELKLRWQWVQWLLQESLSVQNERHYTSDLQIDLLNRTTIDHKDDVLLGSLKLVHLTLPTSNLTQVETVAPGSDGSVSGTIQNIAG